MKHLLGKRNQLGFHFLLQEMIVTNLIHRCRYRLNSNIYYVMAYRYRLGCNSYYVMTCKDVDVFYTYKFKKNCFVK